MYSRNAVLAFAGTLLVAASGFAQSTTASTHTRTSDLSPVGLAVGETVQVNVANLAANSTSGTAASCAGSVSFYNASGAIIGAATTFTLTTGQISTVRLPYASAGASGSRTVVRPVVTLTTTLPSPPPCSLQFSLETFDTATGVTHVHTDGGVLQGGFVR